MNMNDLLKISDKELMATKPKELAVKEKLTNWSKEPSVRDLKHDLTQAQSNQSKYISKLVEWERLYDAPKYGTDKHRGSRVVPKLVRKQAEWLIPSLTEPFLSTNNLYDVRAISHDDVRRAKQNALVLNKQFNTQLDKVKFVSNVVRQLVKKGTCIVRTGWEYYEKEVLEDVEQFQYQPIDTSVLQQIPPEAMEQAMQQYPELQAIQQLQSEYERLAQLQIVEPDTYEQQPSELKAGFEMSQEQGQLLQATSIGFKKEKVVKPVSNKPTAIICDIKNVYIDPTCKGDIDKAQFIIYGFETSLSDLRKMGKYKNLAYLEQAIVGDSDGTYHGYSDFKFADSARRKLIAYEYWGYWDIDGTGITQPIKATWVGDVLIGMELNPFPDGKPPFVIFTFIPDEDSVYGVPNAELLGDNQEILGAVTRGMIDLMGKSANSQTGYVKNFLDATNKQKFLKGMDYEYNQGIDPRLAVYTHTYPEIPNSASYMVSLMNNEAESLSGVKAFSNTGITAKGLGDVATGVRGVFDAVSKRENSILRHISDGFISLGRKIISMNSEFLSEEEVVRVTNTEFIKVRRDDLAGEYDLVLTISSAEVDENKAQQLAFLMQTIGNSMGMGLTQMILSEIATLRKMPDLAKAIMEYQEQPDEMQQQLQQLEMQKLQAEIALLQSQAQENQAQAQVQQAKVGTEQAKASNLQAQADEKTISTAKDMDGTKHLEAMENQQVINDGLNQREMIKGENALNQQTLGGLIQGDMSEYTGL